MADPEVVKTTQMSTGLATVDVRDASANGVALMEERVKNQKKMLAIAVGLTSPKQWAMFGESIYPSGGAADTILRRAFGLSWGERTITIEETPDGKLCTCTAWLMQGDVQVEQFTGYRFIGGFIKNEADLRKGAAENMKSVAVRDLLGLRFRTPAELKEMGLDVSKITTKVEYQDNTVNTNPSEAVVPYGKHKGELVVDQDDKGLEWLGKAVRQSVEDPAKAKWKDKNQKLLDAINGEWLRRHPKNGAAETSTQQPKPEETPPQDADYGPPPMTAEEAKAALDNTRSRREPGEDG